MSGKNVIFFKIFHIFFIHVLKGPRKRFDEIVEPRIFFRKQRKLRFCVSRLTKKNYVASEYRLFFGIGMEKKTQKKYKFLTQLKKMKDYPTQRAINRFLSFFFFKQIHKWNFHDACSKILALHNKYYPL